MDDELEQLKEKLLKAEIIASEVKIKAIDKVIESGTIEKKLDLILLDIRSREVTKRSQNHLKLEESEGNNAERID